MPELQTERLILRMLRESDLDAYAEMLADPEVTRFIGNGQPVARWEAWRNMAMMVGHWQLRGYGQWGVEERASGRMIGRIGCWNPEGWPGIEVGWLLRRDCWGRGLATEGARAAMNYAFEELRLARVISLIRTGNHNSIRVAERLGERLSGKIDLHGFETLIYAIEREEWLHTRPASSMI